MALRSTALAPSELRASSKLPASRGTPNCNISITVRSGAELRCAPVSSATMGGRRKRPVGLAEKWKCWHAVPEHLQYLLPHPGTSWLERGPVGCYRQCEGLWRCSPCPRRPHATWQHLIEADHLVNVLAWLQEPETVARLQAMQGAMHGVASESTPRSQRRQTRAECACDHGQAPPSPWLLLRARRRLRGCSSASGEGYAGGCSSEPVAVSEAGPRPDRGPAGRRIYQRSLGRLRGRVAALEPG